MRIVVVALTFAALVVGLPAVASAQPSCTTIQSGTLLNSAGEILETGFDEWGYNYQAVIAAIPAANKDPRFMQAQLFQAPRAIRLGLRLDF